MSETKMKQLRARYERAAHAVQTGVALKMERGGRDATPKHLRVGVNMAMVEHAALAQLLIEKGVITELEYYEALADGTEDEQRLYEESLGVTLA